MRKVMIQGHNNNRHLTQEELDNNIGGLPVTDAKIREVFDQLDSSKNGFLEFNELKKWYRQFENYGLEYTDKEIDTQVRKYSKSEDGTVTYDEFACIVLALAQR
jgi:Ca2+-binding EF-hand superfamily protein